MSSQQVEERDAEDAQPSRPKTWAWVLPLAIFLATFGLYAVTAERHAVGSDAYASSAQAWRITTSGHPWFDGMDVKKLQGVHSPIELGRWIEPAPNGHVVAQRMVGTVLVALPFYALLTHDGQPQAFSVGPGGLAAATLTAGTVLLMFLALRRKVSAALATAGALAFAFATPTWSVSANGIWTHTLTQFGIAGAAYAFGKDRWWLAGAFLGFGMLARPHLAVVAAVVGLGIAWSRRDVRPAIGVGVPAALSLGLISVWNHWMFGVWSLTGAGYAGKATGAVQGFAGSTEADVSSSQLLNYLGFFVSPGRGLFVWTPVLLLFLPALVRRWRHLPDWSRWLLVAGLAYTFVQLRVGYFAGGVGFYSYRHGLELLTCAVPALVFSAPGLGKVARWLIPPVISLQVAMISIGAIQEAYFIQMERMWADNNFWVALRFQPGVVGTWVALCLAVGLLVTVMVNRSRAPAAD